MSDLIDQGCSKAESNSGNNNDHRRTDDDNDISNNNNNNRYNRDINDRRKGERKVESVSSRMQEKLGLFDSAELCDVIGLYVPDILQTKFTPINTRQLYKRSYILAREQSFTRGT
ncbi:putative uncharacterized protein DDB_G0283223 [Octopus sinensis]|uniref:Uncharacterized protein n=1 Tax=Octopus sinensis TaxID=2607531 RepID=A0A6P7SIB8_9MOLL|nr:putative uncharacterized protein DDB_G0283223 [Octopus sinensis]